MKTIYSRKTAGAGKVGAGRVVKNIVVSIIIRKLDKSAMMPKILMVYAAL